jgi:hypothetical protein
MGLVVIHRHARAPKETSQLSPAWSSEMIEDYDQAWLMVSKMTIHLPIPARPTPKMMRALSEQGHRFARDGKPLIQGEFQAGDESGIVCGMARSEAPRRRWSWPLLTGASILAIHWGGRNMRSSVGSHGETSPIGRAAQAILVYASPVSEEAEPSTEPKPTAATSRTSQSCATLRQQLNLPRGRNAGGVHRGLVLE